MAILADQDRADATALLQSDMSRDREQIAACLKADLRAAFNATDQWVSDNAASFNAALPIAARNNLTAAQKSRLFVAVLTKRYQKGT